jgi:hypothetical protein
LDQRFFDFIVTAMDDFKKAIAVIAYNKYEYFKAVLNSILSQKVRGQPLFDYYDLYIFQDGLQDRHAQTAADHAAVKNLAVQSVGEERVFQQSKNLGIAKHFYFVESFLFEAKGYEFALFCEHDMILGEKYLHQITVMAEKFRHDQRIAMISAHSQNYRQSIEEQRTRRHEYSPMGHNWGFGMFRSRWLKWRPVYQDYLDLVKDTPYYQRNHAVIQEWQKQCGFKAGATSQDYAKSCVIAALKMLRISTYPNFGFYIGEEGEHFTKDSYEKFGFRQTQVFGEAIDDLREFDDATYKRHLDNQARWIFLQGTNFDYDSFCVTAASGLYRVAVPDINGGMKATSEDIVAAYRIFLNRLPENRQVIESRIGLPLQEILSSFLLSDEFSNRVSGRKSVLEAAHKINLAKAADKR